MRCKVKTKTKILTGKLGVFFSIFAEEATNAAINSKIYEIAINSAEEICEAAIKDRVEKEGDLYSYHNYYSAVESYCKRELYLHKPLRR